jgi:hypothetical protein
MRHLRYHLIFISTFLSTLPAQDTATLADVEGYFKARNMEAKASESPLSYEIEDFTEQNPGQRRFSWDQIKSYQPRNTKFLPEPTNKWTSKGDFLLRRSHSDVLQSEDRTPPGKNAKTFKDLEGALLSYQHDNNANSDTWGFRGAFIYSQTWSKDSAVGSHGLYEAGIAPSITFNKLDTSGAPGSEVDQLTFRMGGWGNWFGGDPWFRNKITVFATYSTDTSFEKSVYAGEFDIHPGLHLGKYAGLGSYHALWSPGNNKGINNTRLGYQLDLVIHGEGGTVDDAGDSGIAEEGFFRVGPKLELSVFPFFHPDLTWNSKYTYLFDVAGDNKEPSYFKTALVYAPDEAKNWAIQVEYEKGGLDLTKDAVDQITAGITVKF